MSFFKLYMKGYIEFMLGALGALYIVVSMIPALCMEMLRRRSYTCNKCDMVDGCPYVWDKYNQDGDCLNNYR